MRSRSLCRCINSILCLSNMLCNRRVDTVRVIFLSCKWSLWCSPALTCTNSTILGLLWISIAEVLSRFARDGRQRSLPQSKPTFRQERRLRILSPAHPCSSTWSKSTSAKPPPQNQCLIPSCLTIRFGDFRLTFSSIYETWAEALTPMHGCVLLPIFSKPAPRAQRCCGFSSTASAAVCKPPDLPSRPNRFSEISRSNPRRRSRSGVFFSVAVFVGGQASSASHRPHNNRLLQDLQHKFISLPSHLLAHTPFQAPAEPALRGDAFEIALRRGRPTSPFLPCTVVCKELARRGGSPSRSRACNVPAVTSYFLMTYLVLRKQRSAPSSCLSKIPRRWLRRRTWAAIFSDLCSRRTWRAPGREFPF